jgi:hypothetical protein
MVQPKHQAPDWDMHNEHDIKPFSLPADEIVQAEVICHDPFGLGLYLPDYEAYAHVNIPEVSDTAVDGPAEFPPIGSKVRARSFGPSARPGRPPSMSLRNIEGEDLGNCLICCPPRYRTPNS